MDGMNLRLMDSNDENLEEVLTQEAKKNRHSREDITTALTEGRLPKVVHFKPLYEALGNPAEQIVEWLASDLNFSTQRAIGERNKVGLASALKTMREAHSRKRPIAWPKNRNRWSEYPLAGATVIGKIQEELLKKGYLELIQGSGRTHFEESSEDGGYQRRIPISSLYRVLDKFDEIEGLSEATFIDVGRTRIEVTKPETQLERDKRKGQNKKKPRLQKTKCKATFGEGYKQRDEEVKVLNSYWKQYPLEIPSTDGLGSLYAASATRVFNDGRLDAGGRFYGLWTNIPSEKRLQCKIDSEAVVELDVNAAQLVFFSSLMGETIPALKDGSIDIYGTIADKVIQEGEDRKKVRKKIKQVTSELVGSGNPNKQRPSGEARIKGITQEEWVRYRDALIEAVPALRHLDQVYLNGANFVAFHESEMLLQAMLTLKDMGIPSYPMHDCIILKKSDQEAGIEVYRQTMNAYIKDHCIKNNRPEVIDIEVGLTIEASGEEDIKLKGKYLN